MPTSPTPVEPAARSNRHARRTAAAIERRQVRSTHERSAPLPDALAYTVEDTRRTAGIGRTKIYELIRDGKLKASRAAGRTLILGDSLRALLSADSN